MSGAGVEHGRNPLRPRDGAVPCGGDFLAVLPFYKMGLLKPDPAFFHHVLGTLDTPAADCVFIDDRGENVEAARVIGITALQFKSV